MTKYLYGASIQGIQDFIFKTNKLKEIIGASEIVKSIDTIKFIEEYDLNDEIDIILQAAGNIRIAFDSKDDLEKIVLNFPKDIMTNAYGITVSQAVVPYTGDYKSDSSSLEKKLKVQRNIVSIPLDMNFSILERNARTAKPLINKDNDIATKQKINKCPKNEEDNDLKDISNTKNKIAVIHADGNGLGNIVKDLSKDDMKEFSSKLDNLTKESFNIAKEEIKNGKYREVILGGDDLTIICDATYALEFTHKFLEVFEVKTQSIHKNLDLTACAGITFCNEKYPMHYALKLAEDLCKHAKTHAKNINKDLAPSCLMFHNIQSSNVQSFDKFIEDELTIKNKRLDFGPYYLSKNNEPLIKDFLNVLEEFKKENSPKGRLRDWLNDLEYDQNFADNQLKRIVEMSDLKGWEGETLSTLHCDLKLSNLFVKKDEKEKTPIYDILQILSIKGEN